ncbi:hypothetical protein MA16_Dca024920 [Dendrobium catenatum]|uniref:Uncharacterized protein n=1 Tax=Dendrobium catenatum TaxID=906689 RepID=A0A2I0WDE0_9ASPA|nr:hypothetical protein MA16_Dca024920 [Dendrobium catenatum]
MQQLGGLDVRGLRKQEEMDRRLQASIATIQLTCRSEEGKWIQLGRLWVVEGKFRWRKKSRKQEAGKMYGTHGVQSLLAG